MTVTLREDVTLDEADRRSFLAVATAIAERLCGSARPARRGCFWEVPRRRRRSEPVRYVAGGGALYHGSAGTALFLLRLGLHTGDERCLETARRALDYALAQEDSVAARGGYYSGTAGVAAVCAEMAAGTGEGRWRDAALRLCRNVAAGLEPPGQLDLVAGEAGSLLGLLQVYDAEPEPAVLAAAEELAELLIAGRRPEPEGIS